MGLLVLMPAAAGCALSDHATIAPAMTYRSTLPVPKTDLAVDVRVAFAPGTIPWALHQGEDELTESLRASLVDDLKANGPFSIADARPDATLAVEVNWLHEYHDTGVAAPGFGLSILYTSVPPVLGWLIWPTFGSPNTRHEISTRGVARVLSPDGRMLAEVKTEAECVEYSTMYQEHVTFECAVRKMIEGMRTKLALQSAKILAAKSGPARESPKSAKTEGSWVVAVMDVEDLNAGSKGRAIDPSLVKNLVDQVRVFVAQRGVRTIDRSTQERAIRDQITAMKRESYAPCYQDACQIELGKALAASHILRSRITRFGGRCVLNAELIDLRTEVTTAASSAQGDCKEEGFLAMSETVTAALIGR